MWWRRAKPYVTCQHARKRCCRKKLPPEPEPDVPLAEKDDLPERADDRRPLHNFRDMRVHGARQDDLNYTEAVNEFHSTRNPLADKIGRSLIPVVSGM